MRTLTLTLTLTALILLLTNCGGDEPPKDLLKHTVHKEYVSDTPLKTQVSIDIIIGDKDNATEQKLQKLLTYLYDQQINRTGFKHHDHPNTVLIYAYASKELADGGMGQWVAMISKMYDDTKPDFDLNETQFKALTAVEQDKWGLTQQQRQEIWDKIIYAERDAQTEADKKYPLDKPGITKEDMSNNVDLMTELKEKNEQDLAKEYEVDRAIVDSIGLEGVTNGWPFPR
jgi:hypothetical protein